MLTFIDYDELNDAVVREIYGVCTYTWILVTIARFIRTVAEQIVRVVFKLRERRRGRQT